MSFSSVGSMPAAVQVVSCAPRAAPTQWHSHAPQLLQLSHWRPSSQMQAGRRCQCHHSWDVKLQAFVTETADLADANKVFLSALCCALVTFKAVRFWHLYSGGIQLVQVHFALRSCMLCAGCTGEGWGRDDQEACVDLLARHKHR